MLTDFYGIYKMKACVHDSIKWAILSYGQSSPKYALFHSKIMFFLLIITLQVFMIRIREKKIMKENPKNYNLSFVS